MLLLFCHMSDILKIYSKVIIYLVFLLALAILVIHSIALVYGFYFTGDTITFFVPAYPGRKGDLLAVFAWFYASFPPFVSFVFNFFRFLPVSFITQHHLYLILSNILSTIAAYLIAKQITTIKKWQIIMLSSLFIGSQAVLFLTALSEPLFIFMWLSAMLTVERFISTKKERYLLLFTLIAALMPITRYIGIVVVANLEFIVLIFTYLTWKQKKYSPSLVLAVLTLTWVPITMTVIRNQLIAHSFFGHFDNQFLPMLTMMKAFLTNFSIYIISYRDIILVLTGLLIGAQIKWNKHLKNFTIMCGTSSIVYYLDLIIILSKYRNESALPFRYYAVGYPILILLSIGLGSLLVDKFPRLTKITTISLIVAAIALGNELSISANRLNAEIKSPQSVIRGENSGSSAGAEHSADIRRFCRGKTPNKYLLIQESSRNWVAQSLNFYCQPINIIPMKEASFQLSKGSLVYTPYKLNIPQLEVVDIYQGTKEVFLYKANDKITLDTLGISKKLHPLD